MEDQDDRMLSNRILLAGVIGLFSSALLLFVADMLTPDLGYFVITSIFGLVVGAITAADRIYVRRTQK